MDGDIPSLRGSPTNPRMVTNQPKDGPLNKEVYYRLGIWHLHITPNETDMDGHLSSLAWSPTNPRMVTHQKEVHNKLVIWH